MSLQTLYNWLLPTAAANGISAVSGTLPSGGTIANFGTSIRTLLNSSVPLLYSIAILMTVISGIGMIVSQSDDATSKATRTFIGSVTGLILLALTTTIYNAIWGNQNIVDNPSGVASGISTEIIGVVNYVSMAVGVIAMLMIIISGIRAIINFGSDDGIADLRRTVVSVLFGMIVIAVRSQIANSIAVTYNPDGLINIVISAVQSFLSFLAAIAVLIIVYAGLLMILNLGQEDQYKQAKDIIVRVFIGFIIIVSSKAILNAIFTAF